MTIDSYLGTNTISLLVAIAMLPVGTAFGWPKAQDPTVPSPQIAGRLASTTESNSQTTSDDDANKLSLHQLRLRAMVLRNKDNGTALVSFGESQNYVVRLRRPRQGAPTSRLNLGGFRVAIKDFSESTIVFQNLETKEQFIIH